MDPPNTFPGNVSVGHGSHELSVAQLLRCTILMKGPVEACSGAHHLVLALPCQGGFLKLETTMATFKSILFDLDGTSD